MKVKDQELVVFAKTLLNEAGKKIKQSFLSTIRVETKSSPNDLVTNIDKEIETFFIDQIKKEFPTHRILGEEGNGDTINELRGTVWIIDPIDGTTNFVHQKRNFAISVGIYEDGIGKMGFIYDVVGDELYYAVKGMGAFLNDVPLDKLKPVGVSDAILGLNATWVTANRRIDPHILGALVKDVRGTRSYGSACLEMAYVAAGRLDAYITLRLSPWDFAAGLIILEEVGGISSTLTGEPIKLLSQNTVLMAKPGLHEEIFQTYIRGKI